MRKLMFALVAGLLSAVFPLIAFSESVTLDVVEEVYEYVRLERDVRMYGEEYLESDRIAGAGMRDENSPSVLYRKELFNDSLNMHSLDLLMHRKLVSHDESLSGFNISKQPALIGVTFFEDFVEEYKGDKDNPHDYETKGYGTEIYIEFRKEGEDWIIVEHTVYNPVLAVGERAVSKKKQKDNWERIKTIFPQFKKIEELNATKSTEGSLIFNRPIKKFKSRKKNEKTIDQGETSSLLLNFDSIGKSSRLSRRAASYWNWSGAAAANYADAYVYVINSDFRYYTDANCTNYVSQCLMAGGKPEIDRGRTSDDSWYYGMFVFTTSYSWAASHNLGMHLGANTNTYFDPVNVNEFDKGDLVFQDMYGDGTSDHTMIFREINYDPNNPDGYVNYNTPARSGESIVEIINRNPSSIFVFAIIGNMYYR